MIFLTLLSTHSFLLPPRLYRLAELLTTDKISELAVLTLFLMYEKKLGRESEWFAVIRELDSAKARSLQGVDSPLLWPDAELETFLRGSPLVKEVRMRKEQIQSEFDELDNVWYLSSVFQDRYAFAPPSEQFRRDLFLQAFGAIQASIVHLRGEGVSFARRFSIIPLVRIIISLFQLYSNIFFFYIKYQDCM